MRVKCWVKDHPEITKTITASNANFAVYGFIWTKYKNECSELIVCTEDEAGERRDFAVQPRAEVNVYELDVD